MDSPQIIFRENLGPRKAGASSHIMSTLTHVETEWQDKTAAKTLHGLPMKDATTDPHLRFHMFCASNKDGHDRFEVGNSDTAKTSNMEFCTAWLLSFLLALFLQVMLSECCCGSTTLCVNTYRLQVSLRKLQIFSKLLI